jgi:predicted RNA binding protein YcfA (HicA-like mRNA interferase family)
VNQFCITENRGTHLQAATKILATKSKVKVRDAIKRLRKDGWVQVRTRGSHRQFRHSDKPGTVTVAGKPGLEVPPGTLNNIFKQAGLK